MRRILMLVLALTLMAPVTNAQYIDCGPGGADCTDFTYGLGNPPDKFGYDAPNNALLYSTF